MPDAPAYPLAPDDAIDPAAVRRVLVTKLRHHGDVLLASPVFTALRRAAPHAEVDALVYGDTAPMLDNHPALSRLFAVDRQWRTLGALARARLEWRLFAQMRDRRYDLLVHLTDSLRGAWLARGLGPRWSVAPERGGRRFWRRSFTHVYRTARPGRPRHAVEANLDALRRLGLAVAESDKPLVLRPRTEVQARVSALLASRAIADRSFAVVHPGSRWLFKTWPPERVRELITRMLARGVPVVVTGAPDERERAYVRAAVSGLDTGPGSSLADLSGTLSLPELAALIARARVFVGVDSAPMHIAAAMQTPVVALFGPSGDVEWGPWRVTHRIAASTRHPCRPCGNDGCGGGKVSECLTTLPVDEVDDALRALLVAAGR